MKVETRNAHFLLQHVMEMRGAALASLLGVLEWEKGVIHYHSDFSHIKQYHSFLQLCQNSGFGTLYGLIHLLAVCRSKGQN